MAHYDDLSPSEKTVSSPMPATEAETERPSATLDFLPDESLSKDELLAALAETSEDRQNVLIAKILTFAPWDEIWAFVDRDEIDRRLPALDLPDSLRASWQSYLKS